MDAPSYTTPPTVPPLQQQRDEQRCTPPPPSAFVTGGPHDYTTFEDVKYRFPDPPFPHDRASMPALVQVPQCPQAEVKPLVSQKGMLVVLNHSPTEGEEGVPIAVDIDLCTTGESGDGELPPMKLRLVIGRTALPTTVRDLSPSNLETSNGQTFSRSVFRLRVTANAPDYAGARYSEQMAVPLTLQAIGPASPNDVLDQVIFGSFTYWGSSASFRACDSFMC